MAPEPITYSLDSQLSLPTDFSFQYSPAPLTPEIRNPRTNWSARPAYPEERSSAWWNTLNSINRGADSILSGLSDIGGWWKGVKQGASDDIDYLSTTGSLAASPDDIYSHYVRGVGIEIAKADSIPFEEGVGRVPSALKYHSGLSGALSIAGGLIEGTTGSLDMLEALHEEGGKPGAKTMKAMSKSVAKTSLSFLAGAGVYYGVAATGVAIAGAPIALGIAGGAALGWGIGKGIDWLAGD